MGAEHTKERCVLCNSANWITFHHLIPKTCHRNKWFRKHFSASEMRERGIKVCRKCHSFIHKNFPEKQLVRELNTLEALLANEKIEKHIEWARKNH